MLLDLPERAIPQRISLSGSTGHVAAGETRTLAELDGPGCIQHIWLTMTRSDHANRQCVIRIYFDGVDIPYVEAPVGDFFGVMHGKAWYPINTRYLSVQAESGYNCYFPMPFAKSARIEFEAGPQGHPVYLMVDWHRYPGQSLAEPRRFCARWRREVPTERYGEDFLMLDADGPGRLLGFVYGVRLTDNTDRWSHGGGDNIYDAISFQESVHMRFGCMQNDVCATTYWYQEGKVRPFFRMPEWRHTAYRQGNVFSRVSREAFPRGTYDISLPDSGSWWLCGPFGNRGNRAMSALLPPETELLPAADYDGLHEEGSAWLTEGSRELGRDRARWVRRAAIHGFVDFNHVFQPHVRGVGATHPGVAVARCVVHVPSAMPASLCVAWDDSMVLRVNDDSPLDLGSHATFRSAHVPVSLRAGENLIVLKLSNTIGLNHGGWVFAFCCRTSEGAILHPRAEKPGGIS